MHQNEVEMVLTDVAFDFGTAPGALQGQALRDLVEDRIRCFQTQGKWGDQLQWQGHVMRPSDSETDPLLLVTHAELLPAESGYGVDPDLDEVRVHFTAKFAPNANFMRFEVVDDLGRSRGGRWSLDPNQPCDQ